MTIVVRFAPSPTGYLHIGSARTALFNMLYARHMGGKFLLRVEDTDKERSTDASTKAILDGLKWLNIDHDGEIVYQSRNIKRHQEVAHKMVELGKAYFCLTPQEEIQQMRDEYAKAGKVFVFESKWRHEALKKEDIKPGDKAVIRLKVDKEGRTEINDLVQKNVVVENSTLDDMVLLRSDGTPTYMLAVVVDDYDMGVTHVIRGDDHLSNCFRQIQIYKSMGWPLPEYAHIPLIHGEDGAKLSKRHGAVGVEEYRELGFLPEALSNYLLRLGWSHGDDEIISRADAIKWFDVSDVNRGAARLDQDKMLHINAQYIMHADNEYLLELMRKFVDFDQEKTAILLRGMNGLKHRAKTIKELAEHAKFYIADAPIPISLEAKAVLDAANKDHLREVYGVLEGAIDWTEDGLKALMQEFVAARALKLGQIAQSLRAALSGSTVSPSVFDIMAALGKEKSLERLRIFK